MVQQILSVPPLDRLDARIGHRPFRRVALALTAVAALAAAVLLGTLHLIRPELDPGSTVVSQYALGPHGWMMALVFGLLAAACVLLAAGVPSDRLRRAGRVGRMLLVVAAAGLALALVFVVGHPLHEVGSLLGNLGLALGAVLLGRDLRRDTSPTARRWSAVAAHAPWVGAVLMAALLTSGTWGFGLLNRLVVLAYAVWLVVAARQAARSGAERRQ